MSDLASLTRALSSFFSSPWVRLAARAVISAEPWVWYDGRAQFTTSPQVLQSEST